MHKAAPRLGAQIEHFIEDTSGAGTVSGLYFFLSALVVGGLALDTANGMRVKTQMQAATDAAALAAAMYASDPETAKEQALRIAEINLPAHFNGAGITESDIEFGSYTNGTFTEGGDEPNAVRVSASRTKERGNEVNTYLLRLGGFASWDIATQSIASASDSPSAGATGTCSTAMFLTSGTMNTGGGNVFDGEICIHGQEGVLTGGNGYYSSDVRLSAGDLDDVVVNSVRSGSATRDEIAVERTMSPTILPNLDTMYDDLWTALSGQATYSGDLLPSFIFDDGMAADVVYVDQGWWSIHPGELQENTIYLVNHGVQFTGGVDAQNVAMIVNGQIGVGGGQGLNFKDVFFFGSGQLNLSGNIAWGDEDYCEEGYYNTYLFSKQRLSMGGWGGAAGTHGVIGAAPQFSPGGGLRSAGGVYIEASEDVSLGGNVNFDHCDTPLSAEYQIVTGSSEETATGAYLVR